MDAAVAHQIWNYIGMLGVDRETARDLYQEAETAIWEAAAHRATSNCHSYLVKTGIGAIRHWLRDRYALVRIPGYLHDRGEATSHMKTIVPLEDVNETVGTRFEDDLLDRLDVEGLRQRVLALLPRLTKAEQQVMEALLTGRSIRDIARERRVRVGCVYAQRSKSILKLRQWLAEGADKHQAPPTPQTPLRPTKQKRPADITVIKDAAISIARAASVNGQTTVEVVGLGNKLERAVHGYDGGHCLRRLIRAFPDAFKKRGQKRISGRVSLRWLVHLDRLEETKAQAAA